MRFSFAEVQEAMARLAARAEAVEIHRFESDSRDQLVSELLPTLAKLMQDARSLVADVQSVCEERIHRTRGPGISVVDGRLPTIPLGADVPVDSTRPSWSVEAVADIAYLAGLELRQGSERLEGLTTVGSADLLLSELDTARRRVGKVLRSLDHALDQAGLATSKLDSAAELDTSLAVRRAYGRLRHDMKAIGTPKEETLASQLRAVGVALATVVGWKGYTSIRIRDRLRIRELQGRLLEWFREGREPTAGLRLFQDVDTFVQILADVSKRQELKQHDTRLVESAWRTLASVDGVIPAHLRSALDPLRGLDAELDALLESPHRDQVDPWKATLARLLQSLCGATVTP
ncbi:hypothetical protein AKJ09_00163 [Labilithrix luteola]|uniref:Uncharacterized protein n=1 Tax=Labilithrix luteola TaxID=1391654 RepID=A0A0K1PK62_9BACT|nr:hypothetical protein [Labilithrix luteola]AKU93499.1 hypothetical protein AKJ09_00163 [Labilithrix luteola]